MKTDNPITEPGSAAFDTSAANPEESGLGLGDLIAELLSHWPLLTAGPLLAGAVALGATGFIAPTFTASTTFIPPQQADGGAASALASSLGNLAKLTGGTSGGARNAGDQYVSLMQSATVSDRLIERFKLMEAYGAKFREDARSALAHNVRIGLGKKDGLIVVEVDDTNPQRAADIANRYVDELRQMTATLAVTEAQQRRVFFEQQLKISSERLEQAQRALQGSGFNPGALKTEPKSAAEAYARLKAETTAAEIRLQAMRGSLTDATPEVRLQQATLAALRDQLSRTTQPSDNTVGPDYLGKYREFKYRETLFEVFARQLEVARADEGREGALIQVVDSASPPERKSKPRRVQAAITTAGLTALILVVGVLVRRAFRRRPVPALPRL